MRSPQDQLYLRRKLQKPEMEFIGVHTCSSYIQSIWDNWNIHSRGGLQSSENRKQDTTKRPNTETKERATAKISLQREWLVGLVCVSKTDIHLKAKTLLGPYLQHRDISEGHMVCSMCSWCRRRRHNGILDAVKARIEKEHSCLI